MTDWNSRKKYFEKRVATCVVNSLPEIVGFVDSDAPDADLEHFEGYRIGLEIVAIQDPRHLHLKGRVESVASTIDQLLKEKCIPGVFTIFVHLDEMREMMESGGKRAWDREVPTRIASLLATNADAVIPSAVLKEMRITCVSMITRREATHSAAYPGWSTTTQSGQSLVEVQLKEKDAKLKNYREKNGTRFREYWLAMASFGPGCSGDDGYDVLLERAFKTNYERVLLIIHDPGGKFIDARDVTPRRDPVG